MVFTKTTLDIFWNFDFLIFNEVASIFWNLTFYFMEKPKAQLSEKRAILDQIGVKFGTRV